MPIPIAIAAIQTMIDIASNLPPPAPVVLPTNLSSKCQEEYEKFVQARAPKAYAVADNGGCGWVSRRQATQLAALDRCSKRGENCKILDFNNWNQESMENFYGFPLSVIGRWRKMWIEKGRDKIESFETFRNRKLAKLGIKIKREHVIIKPKQKKSGNPISKQD